MTKMISLALLLTTIPSLSLSFTFPSDSEEVKHPHAHRPSTNTSKNDTIIADIESVCNDFHIRLDGEMIIEATATKTLNFDWSNLLEGSDWNQDHVKNCFSNVSLLQTINATQDVVIKNIPVDKLNKTYNVANDNFDECQAGLEFSIKFFWSNSKVVKSNTTMYQPNFFNTSDPWPYICKFTKHFGEDRTGIYLNFRDINQHFSHCIKSMSFHEIKKGEETEGSHRYSLEDLEGEDIDKFFAPEDDTSEFRLEFYHDNSSTKPVSGLVREYELEMLDKCPDQDEKVTQTPKAKKSKSADFIFIALGIVLVLAFLIFVIRIYYAKKTLNRAATVKLKADSIAKESTEDILVHI